MALWVFMSTPGCLSRILQAGGTAVGEGAPRLGVRVVCVHLGVCVFGVCVCVCVSRCDMWVSGVLWGQVARVGTSGLAEGLQWPL